EENARAHRQAARPARATFPRAAFGRSRRPSPLVAVGDERSARCLDEPREGFVPVRPLRARCTGEATDGEDEARPASPIRETSARRREYAARAVAAPRRRERQP